MLFVVLDKDFIPINQSYDDHKENVLQSRQFVRFKNLLRRMNAKKVNERLMYDMWQNHAKMTCMRDMEPYQREISTLKEKSATRNNLLTIREIELFIKQEFENCDLLGNFTSGIFLKYMGVTLNEKKTVMSRLRYNIFSESDEVQDDGNRYTVCLSKRKASQRIVVLPCEHTFHDECAVKALMEDPRWPICRAYFFVEFPFEFIKGRQRGIRYH